MLAKAPTNAKDIASIKHEIEDHLYAASGGSVQTGPFCGMKLRREVAWKEAYLPPMILGCYEEELHGALTQQIERLGRFERTPNIAVVGSAEGYYAIGLKRALPKARVYAVEPDDNAIKIMQAAAADNGVEVIVGADLAEVFAAPDLIVMDCEGAEVSYLDLDKFPALAGAHMIVEIHNLQGQDTDEIVLNRFRGTHRISALFEGQRDPNRYPPLCAMPSEYRWLAVSEGRPCLMCWFSMTPRGSAVT